MNSTNLMITGRKLYMCEHDLYGIWFFTTISKVAHAIDSSYMYVHKCLKDGCKRIKGFTITEVAVAGDIPSAYLDANVIFINGKTLQY